MDGLASISPKMAASLTQVDRHPTDLQAAAEQFEALFIQMMLKSMRDAVEDGGLFGSHQLDTY